MKKFFIVFIFIVFVVLSFFIIGNNKQTVKSINYEVTKEDSIEKKALFFSYLEFMNYTKDKDEETSKNNLKNILNNMIQNKFNMLILQVRAFNDAIYESKYFETSDYVKVNGKDPDYDILDFIIKEAKKRNIEVHAWINPYRISNDINISNEEKIKKLISLDEAGIVEGKGIFYNPANLSVNELIINGVEELLNNYEIDGILFDDYFYPSNDIDLKSYEDYSSLGGDLSIIEYRYNNILNLIRDVHDVVKSKNKIFSISPQGNIENNYNDEYLDVEEILSSDLYVDYIMPQIYFGFNNFTKPFTETLLYWDNLIKGENIKLIPSLAFYKVGVEDLYAKDGINEWIENNDIIEKQIIESRKTKNYIGFSLFRYDYLFNEDKFNNNTKEEFDNVLKILN